MLMHVGFVSVTSLFHLTFSNGSLIYFSASYFTQLMGDENHFSSKVIIIIRTFVYYITVTIANGLIHRDTPCRN